MLQGTPQAYSFDQSNPYYQMAQAYEETQAAKSAALMERMQGSMQQMRDMYLRSQAEKNSVNELNRQPIPYIPMPEASSSEDKKPLGFWEEVKQRAVPETKATMWGTLGLLGDLTGMDSVRDFGIKKYLENTELAKNSDAQRQVPTVEDIDWDLGKAATWAKETLQDQLPILATTVASAGVGGIIGGSLAKATGGVVGNLMNKYATTQAAAAIASGAAPEAAIAMGRQLAASKVRNAFIGTGLYGSMGGMEASEAYTRDVNAHGVENTNPLGALGVGIVNAGLERFLGMEGSLVRSITGKAVTDATESAVRKELIKSLPGAIAKSATKEGLTEALQEVSQSINANINDKKAWLTPEDISPIINSFAAGALLGTGFGTAQHFVESGKKLDDTTPTASDTSIATPEITTPKEKAASALDTVIRIRNERVQAVQSAFSEEISATESVRDNARKELDNLRNSNDPAYLKLETKDRTRKIADAERTVLRSEAKLTRYQLGLQSQIDEAMADADKEAKKISKGMVTDEVIAQGNKFFSDPKAYTDITSAAKDGITYASRQINNLNKNLSVIDSRLSALKERLNSREALSDMRVARSMRNQINQLTKTRNDFTKAISSFSRNASAVRDLVSNPKHDMNPQSVDAILAKIYSENAPDGIDAQFKPTDQATFTEIDDSTNRAQEDIDAMVARLTEYMNTLQQTSTEPTTVKETPQMTEKAQDYAYSVPREVDEIDTFLQGTPEVTNTLSGFESTPDKFLQQAIPSTEFESTPDTMLQGRPTVTPALTGFEPKVDRFLRQTPEVTSYTPPAPKPVTATTAIAKRVESAIAPALKSLPTLAKVTSVYDSAQQYSKMNGGPVYDSTTTGIYDSTNQRVVLFADAIERVARTKYKTDKPTHTDIKDIATRTLVHEGVAHYGLGLVLSQTERHRLTSLVEDNYKDDPRYQAIARKYGSEPNNLLAAEEFIADLSEQYTLKQLTKKDAGIFTRIKELFKRLLKSVGFASITDKDIVDVLKRSALNLSNESGATTPMSMPAMPDGVDVMQRMDTAGMGPEEARALSQQDTSMRDRASSLLSNREEFTEKFRENFIDANRPVELLVDEIKKRGGSLDYVTNIYRNLQQLPNKIATDMESAQYKYVEPILTAIANMRQGNEDIAVTFGRVSDYVAAKAAMERNAFLGRDGVAGPEWTNEKSQAIIDRYASPEMNEIVSKFQELNNHRLTLLEQNSILPKEQIDAWRSAYSVYMPFKNWEDVVAGYDPAWYKSSARKNLSTPSIQKRMGARALGRTTEAQNPIIHSFLQMYDVINLKHKVDAQRQLLNLVENNPSYTDLFEISEILTPDNAQYKMGVDREGNVKWKKKKTSTEGVAEETIACIAPDGNIVRVWIKDPRVRMALKGENIARAQGVIQMIGAVQRTLGQLYTSKNPLFWFTNPIKDTLSAAVNMSSVIRDLERFDVPNSAEIAKAIISKGLLSAFKSSSIRGAIYYANRHGGDLAGAPLDDKTRTYMEDYNQFIAQGARTNYFSTAPYDEMKSDVISAMASKNPATRLEKGKAIVENISKWMDAMSDSAENMTRYIAFKSIVDSLRSNAITKNGEKMSDAEVYSRAANIALNLTVNFTRKGAYAPVFNSLYMFASASIGGNVRLLETLLPKNKETGNIDWKAASKFISIPMMAYVAQSTLARMMMPDDDDGINMYDKIPSYIKDNNFIIPTANGEYIKIPMAYGLNVLWTMARNFSDSLYSASTGAQGPSFTSAASNIVSASFDNFSPMGSPKEGWTIFVPSVFRPVAQLYENKNFAGNPIYPDSTHLVRGELPDTQKYWSTTGGASKWMAETLGSLFGGTKTRAGFWGDVSPETIDHMTNAYLGGIGRLGMTMLNTLVDINSGKPLDVAKLPFVSSFYKEPSPSDTTALFTKLRTEAQTQINTIDEMRKTPGLSSHERMQIIQENKSGMQIKNELNNVQAQLNKIRQTERELDRKGATGESKYEKLRQLEDRKLALMKRVIKRAHSLGIRAE